MISLVCKIFSRLGNDNSLWKSLYERSYGSPPQLKTGETFKDLYKALYKEATTIKFKYVVLGENDCKKTKLIKRYVDDEFSTNYQMTIGVDFHTKNVDYEHHPFKIQLWDTAGQERFCTITRAYYKDAHCAIVVVNTQNEFSSDSVEKYLEEIKNHAPENVVIVIVGVYDSTQPPISTKESLKTFAKEQNIACFFANWNSRDEVEKCFTPVNELVVQKHFPSFNKSIFEKQETKGEEKQEISKTNSTSDKKESKSNRCIMS